MVKMKEEESIKGEGSNETKGSRNQEKNTVAIRNQIYNQTCEKHIKTYLLGLCRERFSLNLNQSSYLFLSSESILFVVQFNLAQFSNPLSINSLF